MNALKEAKNKEETRGIYIKEIQTNFPRERLCFYRLEHDCTKENNLDYSINLWWIHEQAKFTV